MNYTEFYEFPKIARLNRGIVITEKIDGTNAQVIVDPVGRVSAASRSRFITPEDDNYGFARWVKENEDQLRLLGEGHHFGEWWGQGIQRNYAQTKKRFSLFNSKRWAVERPECCDVVPILYDGVFTAHASVKALAELKATGSIAAPGFMNPEGIIIWHDAARIYFKATLDKDEEYKGKSK